MSAPTALYPVLDKQPESASRVPLLVFSEVQSCPFFRQELQLRLNDLAKDPEAAGGTPHQSTRYSQGRSSPTSQIMLWPSYKPRVTAAEGNSNQWLCSLPRTVDSGAGADPHCLSGALFPPSPLCLQSAARNQGGCPASKAFSLCRHSWGQEVGSGAEEPGAQFGLRTFFLRSQTQFCVPFERK